MVYETRRNIQEQVRKISDYTREDYVKDGCLKKERRKRRTKKIVPYILETAVSLLVLYGLSKMSCASYDNPQKEKPKQSIEHVQDNLEFKLKR